MLFNKANHCVYSYFCDVLVTSLVAAKNRRVLTRSPVERVQPCNTGVQRWDIGLSTNPRKSKVVCFNESLPNIMSDKELVELRTTLNVCHLEMRNLIENLQQTSFQLHKCN